MPSGQFAGILPPQAGLVKLQSSGASDAEQELVLPAWSVQLRLVHHSQTCWAGSQEQKAPQGPELMESGSLQAC